MKKLITAIFLLGVFCGLVKAGENKNLLMASDTVVWAGLDYSMVRIIGNTNDIKVPEMFFQDMPQKWNDLFLDERIEGMANSLDKRVFIDVAGVTERNANILTNKNIFEPDTTDAFEKDFITRQDIATAISSYKMEHTNGLGLVFIVDSIIYHHDTIQLNASAPVSHPLKWAEGVNVVFFDIATREIISAKRKVKTVATGGSFRNFWFGPIKETDSGLAEYK